MKISGKKTSRSNETFQLLRHHILSGSIPAGSRMRINDLCKQFSVSLGAVREALSQLLAQGLVVSEAHRGFTVAPISRQDLIDLTRVFVEVHILCLTWSMKVGNVEWESNILSAMHRLSKVKRVEADGKPTAEWKEAHHRFQCSLIAACDSPRLLQIWQQLYEQSERYRRLNASLSINQTSFSEDQLLTNAVLARDIPAATRYSRDHINMLVKHVLKAMSNPAVPRRASATKKQVDPLPSSQPKSRRSAVGKLTSRLSN